MKRLILSIAICLASVLIHDAGAQDVKVYVDSMTAEYVAAGAMMDGKLRSGHQKGRA